MSIPVNPSTVSHMTGRQRVLQEAFDFHTFMVVAWKLLTLQLAAPSVVPMQPASYIGHSDMNQWFPYVLPSRRIGDDALPFTARTASSAS